MPITNEILNTTFSSLKGPLVNSFKRSNETWDALEKKSKMPMEGGSLIERSFSGSAPAFGVGVFVGDELLNLTRRQQIRRYRVEPHRLVVAVNIPKKELNYNSGKLAVMKIIDEYPKTTVIAAISDINSFILTGVSRGLVFQTAELEGLATLNGQHTTGRGTGLANGLLEFVAFATQSATVQDVAKSSTYFHANQFRDITAWNTNGLFRLRQAYRECAHYADDGKGPDVVVMDDETFGNFEQSKLADVRIKLVGDKIDSDMLASPLGLAVAKSSLDLDRAQFTGVAADGVTYMLNTDYIEFPMHEAPSMTDFKERVGDQDVVTAIWSMQGNLVCTKFPAQGCVSGGAL